VKNTMCSTVPCRLSKIICSVAVWRFIISRCDVGWNVAQSLSKNWNWWSDPKFKTSVEKLLAMEFDWLACKF